MKILPSLQIEYHSKLAKYFEVKDYFQESIEQQRNRATKLPPSPRPVNTRKVVELPWQRIQSQNWVAVEELFTDLHFLESKTECGKVFDLVTEFSLAINSLPLNSVKHGILSLIYKAICRDIHFIASHPTTLFQCLWNTCWWYDSPESQQYLETSILNTITGEDLNAGHYYLYQLMEDWRKTKEIITPGHNWLKSLTPPSPGLDRRQRVVLREHTARINEIAMSPDGKMMASCADDGHIILWDYANSKLIAKLQAGSSFAQPLEIQRLQKSGNPLFSFRSKSVAFSADGKYLYGTTFWSGSARIWDVASQALLLDIYPQGGPGVEAALSISTMTIVAWNEHRATIWDTAAPAPPLRTLNYSSDSDTQAWTDARFSWDGRLFVSRANGIIENYGDEGRKDPVVFGSIGIYSSGLNVSSDGNKLLAWGKNGYFAIWDTNSGKQTHNFRYEGAEVVKVFFASDGKSIYSFGIDGAVNRYDVEADYWRCLIDTTIRAKDSIPLLALSLDGTLLALEGQQGVIEVRDVQSNNLLATLIGHTAQITSITFSPDAQLLFSASADLSIIGWEWRSSEPMQQRIPKSQPRLQHLQFTQDGSKLITTSTDGSITVWNSNSGAVIEVFHFRNDICTLAISQNFDRIAAASKDGFLGMWQVSKGLLWQLPIGNASDKEIPLCFSSDGKQIVIWSGKAVCVLDSETGAELRRLEDVGSCVLENEDDVVGLKYIGKDESILIVSAVCGCLIWSPNSKPYIMSLNGIINNGVIANSPDRRLVAIGGMEAFTILDITTGAMLMRCGPHNGAVVALHFSPNGKFVVSEGAVGDVHITKINNGGGIRLDYWTDPAAFAKVAEYLYEEHSMATLHDQTNLSIMPIRTGLQLIIFSIVHQAPVACIPITGRLRTHPGGIIWANISDGSLSLFKLEGWLAE